MKNIFDPKRTVSFSTYCIIFIISIGIILQLLFGNIDFSLLASPISYIIFLLITSLCIYFGTFYRHTKFSRFVSSITFSVALIVSILILSLIMGLTTQQEIYTSNFSESASLDSSWIDSIGFSAMTSSWPFVLIYLSLLLSLGILTVRRLANFNIRYYSFYLNHLGLWILLASAGIGATDTERYIMRLTPDNVQNIAIDTKGQIKDLPINIRLNKFTIDHYPAQIAVVDIEKSIFIGSSPRDIYHQISGNDDTFVLGNWSFCVNKYHNNLDLLQSKDLKNADFSSKIVQLSSHQGAYITATNQLSADSIVYEGLLTYNPHNPSNSQILGLTWPEAAIMIKPEVSSYESNITISKNSNKATIDSASIRVNHPLSFGAWKIYQHGYHSGSNMAPMNKALAPDSYVSLELVYDPWIIPAYIGIVLLMLGAVTMLWSGKRISKTTTPSVSKTQ